jgi:hypothetical protein
LTNIDLTEDNIINQTETATALSKDPDGVAWIGTDYFATADEGSDSGTGSRGMTIYQSSDGAILYHTGSTVDHICASVGHYDDRRSGNQGNEPSNVVYGEFEETSTSNGVTTTSTVPFLLLSSQRGSLNLIYDVSDVTNPKLVQVLPVGLGPEGGLFIPSRNLMLVASEVDFRNARSTISIYERSKLFHDCDSIIVV